MQAIAGLGHRFPCAGIHLGRLRRELARFAE
jgi:hypothetical protein